MPWDCGLLCLLTDRRRYIEILWRNRLLVTADERKAKRRFMNLMRGFDTEDLDVLRKAIETRGLDIKQCAPGPPMDLVEDSDSDDEPLPLPASAGRRASVISASRLRRYSTVRMDHVGGTTMVTTVMPMGHNHIARVPTHRHQPPNQTSSPHNQGSQRHSHRSPYSGRLPMPPEEANAHQTEPPPRPNRPGTSLDTPQHMNLIGNTGEFEERGLIPQIDRPMSMPYLCCKMWRWKDLQVDAALHRLDPLPWCRFGRVTINNATVSCCNPYHYGLWIRRELVFQGYLFVSAEFSQDKKQSGIVANGGGRLGERSTTHDTGFDDEMSAQAARSIGHVRADFQSNVTMTENVDVPPTLPPPPIPLLSSPTNNNLPIPDPLLLNHLTSIHSHALAWGRMARWERKERVGDMVPLVGDFVAVGQLAGTVFDGQEVKCGWDVDNHASFALMKQSEDENFEDIWLYNSGERPIFLCVSQSLHNPRSDTIRRLSPGYCLRVHRKSTEVSEETTTLSDLSNAPNSLNMAFLTISVGVGWGINYQRLYVSETPCRYEIIFS